MRRFAIFTILFLSACFTNVTGTREDSLANAYTLESVDRDSLPARADASSGSHWVLSGSLTLQPDGYYVISERDSIWNGRTFSRHDETEGGTWTANGSMLTLSDTAAAAMDAYGPAAPNYFGSVAPHAVELMMPTDDGPGTHVYRYAR